jgi:hypothetical protein
MRSDVHHNSDAELVYPFLVAYSKIPRNQAVRLANKTYPILGDNPATYMLALDVFHELHCLVSFSSLNCAQRPILPQDEIRKAMYPDYYPHTSEGINTNHMHHCQTLKKY